MPTFNFLPITFFIVGNLAIDNAGLERAHAESTDASSVASETVTGYQQGASNQPVEDNSITSLLLLSETRFEQTGRTWSVACIYGRYLEMMD